MVVFLYMGDYLIVIGVLIDVGVGGAEGLDLSKGLAATFRVFSLIKAARSLEVLFCAGLFRITFGGRSWITSSSVTIGF